MLLEQFLGLAIIIYVVYADQNAYGNHQRDERCSELYYYFVFLCCPFFFSGLIFAYHFPAWMNEKASAVHAAASLVFVEEHAVVFVVVLHRPKFEGKGLVFGRLQHLCGVFGETAIPIHRRLVLMDASMDDS